MLNNHTRLNLVHLITLSCAYGVFKRLQQEKEEIYQIRDIHLMQKDATDGEAKVPYSLTAISMCIHAKIRTCSLPFE